MKKAILHLGFHKTGTTFLQLATRRWIESQSNGSPSVFYSSQHMPISGWRRLRADSCLRLRDCVARAPLQWEDGQRLEEHLAGIDVLSEYASLRKYFGRTEDILIHSDENSIGVTPGHTWHGPRRLRPFYPNGEWLCATYAAAAQASYPEVHLVFSLRRFDHFVVSSYKDAVRGHRPIPPLELFRSTLADVGARCRAILERVVQLESVRCVHVLDYELLESSGNAYFAIFRQLIGAKSEHSQAPINKHINASPSDAAILDRLVQRGMLTSQERANVGSIASLIGPEFLQKIYDEYQELREDLTKQAGWKSRLRYYRLYGRDESHRLP